MYMHLLESGLARSSVFTPLMHMLGKADARIDPEVLTNECAGKIREWKQSQEQNHRYTRTEVHRSMHTANLTVKRGTSSQLQHALTHVS